MSSSPTPNNSRSTASVPLHGAAVTAILKLLNHQGLMTVATNSPEGQPHISTLGYDNDGLNLYFMTARDSEKRRNLLADSRLSVAIRGRAEEGEAVGLSIEGRAQEVQSPDELKALEARIKARTPDQAPFAPAHEDAVVFKLAPHRIKAVAVIEGHSRTVSFSIGKADLADEALDRAKPYAPSAIARLF